MAVCSDEDASCQSGPSYPRYNLSESCAIWYPDLRHTGTSRALHGEGRPMREPPPGTIVDADREPPAPMAPPLPARIVIALLRAWWALAA
jgi:hypothetical protein